MRNTGKAAFTCVLLCTHLVLQHQLAVGCDDGVLSQWQLQQLPAQGLQLNRATRQGCGAATASGAAAAAATGYDEL
jgi:hypothetical protein